MFTFSDWLFPTKSPLREKFHIVIDDGREFIVSAADEVHAIQMLWFNEAQRLTGDELPSDLVDRPFFAEYQVHRGRAIEAKTVHAGAAFWPCPQPLKWLVAHVLEAKGDGSFEQLTKPGC